MRRERVVEHVPESAHESLETLNRAQVMAKPWVCLAPALTIMLVSGCGADNGADVRTIADEYTFVADLVLGQAVGRLSAEIQGDDSVTFAIIGDVLPLPSGGMVVYDAMVPTLFLFDQQGDFVRTISREGEGPGEFREVAGLALTATGDVMVREPRRALLTFSPSGEFIHEWPIRTSWLSERALLSMEGGGFAVRGGVSRPAGARQAFYLMLDERGDMLDTVFAPMEPRETRGYFGVEQVFEVLPSGDLIHGLNTEYSLLVGVPGRFDTISRDVAPAVFEPEERAQWEVRQEFLRSRSSLVEYPEIPIVKPFIRSVLPSRTGDVWVWRYTVAQRMQREPAPMPDGIPPLTAWEETLVMDRFGTDRRYAGTYRGPAGITPMFISGDTVWAVAQGEFDEDYVVRMTSVPSTELLIRGR